MSRYHKSKNKSKVDARPQINELNADLHRDFLPKKQRGIFDILDAIATDSSTNRKGQSK